MIIHTNTKEKFSKSISTKLESSIQNDSAIEKLFIKAFNKTNKFNTLQKIYIKTIFVKKPTNTHGDLIPQDDEDFSLFSVQELNSIIGVIDNQEPSIEVPDHLRINDIQYAIISTLSPYSQYIQTTNSITEEGTKCINIYITPITCIYSFFSEYKNGEMEDPLGADNQPDKHQRLNLAYFLNQNARYKEKNIDKILQENNNIFKKKSTINIEKVNSIKNVCTLTEDNKKQLSKITFIINNQVIDSQHQLYHHILDKISMYPSNLFTEIMSFISGSNDSFQLSNEKLNQDSYSIKQALSSIMNVSKVSPIINNTEKNIQLIFHIECDFGNKIHNIKITNNEYIEKPKIKAIQNMIRPYVKMLNKIVDLEELFTNSSVIEKQIQNELNVIGFKGTLQRVNNTLKVHLDTINHKQEFDIQSSIVDPNTKQKIIQYLGTDANDYEISNGIIKNICKNILGIETNTTRSDHNIKQSYIYHGSIFPTGLYSNIINKHEFVDFDNNVLNIQILSFFMSNILGTLSSIKLKIPSVKFIITNVVKNIIQVLQINVEAKVMKLFSTLHSEVNLNIGVSVSPLEMINLIRKAKIESLFTGFIELVYKIQNFSVKLRTEHTLKEIGVKDIVDALKNPKLSLILDYQQTTNINNWILQILFISKLSKKIDKSNSTTNELNKMFSTSIELSGFYEGLYKHWAQYLRISYDMEEYSAPFIKYSNYIIENTSSTKFSYTVMRLMDLINSKRFLGDASMFQVLCGMGGSIGKIMYLSHSEILCGIGLAIIIAMQNVLSIVIHICYDPLKKDYQYGISFIKIPTKTNAKLYQPYGLLSH